MRAAPPTRLTPGRTAPPPATRPTRRRTTRTAYLPIRCTPGELAAVEAYADARGVSLSEAARRLIRDALEREGIAVAEPSGA